MRIIRVNRLLPTRVRCEHCGSRLRVDPEDIHRSYNTDTTAYFTCPACRRDNYFGVSVGFWARLEASK